MHLLSIFEILELELTISEKGLLNDENLICLSQKYVSQSMKIRNIFQKWGCM